MEHKFRVLTTIVQALYMFIPSQDILKRSWIDKRKICFNAHIYKAQYDYTTDHILQLVCFVD